VGRVITFKARPNKAVDRYYIYIPKEWSPEIRRVHERRGRLIVSIEIPD